MRNESLYAGSGSRYLERNTVSFTPSKDKRNLFSGNPYINKGFGSESKTSDKVGEGDRVSHAKFGEGEVLEINRENDVVTVSFDKESFGIRKLKLSMAGLKKIN